VTKNTPVTALTIRFFSSEEVKQAQAEHEARIAKEGNDNASDLKRFTLTPLILFTNPVYSQMERPVMSAKRAISAWGVYFFLSVAGLRLTPVEGFVIFVPYILSILYLLISELYLKNENPINSWAYTMSKEDEDAQWKEGIKGYLSHLTLLECQYGPKKSWEGSIGGGLLVLIVAGVIGYFTNTDTDPHMLSLLCFLPNSS